MDKFYQFENKNGIFICFNEFQNESDFIKFISFLEKGKEEFKKKYE